VEVKLFHFAFV